MSDSEDFTPRKRPAPAAQSSARDSSDDDDMPIAQLAKKHSSTNSKPTAMESDSDDDVLLTDLKKTTAAKPKPKAKPNPSKAKATPAKSAAAKKLAAKKGSAKKATPAKKGDTKSPKATPKTKSPAAKKTKGSAKKTAPTRKPVSRQQDSSADKMVTRSSVFYETKKGEMVQKLLCRWWYAIEWPAKADLKPPPSSYLALEGYPGVFIGVEGDDMGKLLDTRNKATCPCFENFSNKSSEELKGLLEVAFTKQKEALVTHWGQGVDEEANIDKELKWLKSVDPTKTDRAAVRALSQAKISN